MYNLGVRPSFATGFAQWPGMSEYPQLWEGLVAAWDPSLGMTGSKLIDWSGRGNHGIITGAVWGSGPDGPILIFTDDIVNCGTGSSINALTEITIYQKLRATTLPSGGEYPHSICQRDDNEARFTLFLNGDSSDDWQFDISTDDISGHIEADAPSTNTWYDLAITYSHSGDKTPKIYINGVDVGKNPVTAVGNIDSTPTCPISIGNRAISLNRDWKGDIGLTYILNRALIDAEIKLLYHLRKRLVA